MLDPQTNQLTSYWSILMILLKNKKIPCIPLLLHQDKFITDFKQKLKCLIIFLLISVLYWRIQVISPHTLKKMHESQTTIDFSNGDILKKYINLDRNKDQDHDMIIRMVKICDVSICKPLKLIFQSCLESGKLPSE